MYRMFTAATVLLSAGLLFPASAATTPLGTMDGISVNTLSQQVLAEVVSDLGFPLGVRRAAVRLDCATGKATVEGFTREDFSFDDTTTPDPEGGKAIIDAKIVQTGPGAVSVRTTTGTLRFLCRDKVLVTDLSGFNDARNDADLKDEFGSNVGLSQYQGLFPNTVTIPAVTFLNKEGEARNTSISFDTAGPNIPGSTAVGDFGLDNYAHEKGQGIFLYDAKANTLAPLRYDGNAAGLRKYQSVTVPKGSQVIFYYAPDYTKATGWQKMVFDLKTMQTWSVPSSKPSNAAFLP